ncbi:MAG: Com family DNA-binding transcriptional regulator [Alcanivorax sp.]|nr:Com family DNA-binding transcriptional regulator [Alcanivorax sp.]
MAKQEIRCTRCHRKLAEAVFTWISIKCPRCGHLNTQQKAHEPR